MLSTLHFDRPCVNWCTHMPVTMEMRMASMTSMITVSLILCRGSAPGYPGTRRQ